MGHARTRQLVPFAVGPLLALLVVAIVRLFDADTAVAAALAGFVAGGLVAGGISFALFFHDLRVDALGGVKPVKAAGIAPNLVCEITTSRDYLVVVTERLEEDSLLPDRPDVMPANRAARPRRYPVQPIHDVIPLAHAGPA
jgi:hypothetical protein